VYVEQHEEESTQLGIGLVVVVVGECGSDFVDIYLFRSDVSLKRGKSFFGTPQFKGANDLFKFLAPRFGAVLQELFLDFFFFLDFFLVKTNTWDQLAHISAAFKSIIKTNGLQFRLGGLTQLDKRVHCDGG